MTQTLVEKVAASSIKTCQEYYTNSGNFGKDWQECHKAIARAATAVVLDEAAKVQPSTADDPNESDYQRGRFDGIIEFATAIRALATQKPVAGVSGDGLGSRKQVRRS